MFEHERITWLKNIYPEFKEEKRFEENVYLPYDLKYFDFFNREEKQYTTVINPKDIVGIEYGFGYNYYRKINWYELLCNLRRLDHVMNNFKTKKRLLTIFIAIIQKMTISVFGNLEHVIFPWLVSTDYALLNF